MAERNRYKITGGRHIHNEKVYEQGDIIRLYEWEADKIRSKVEYLGEPAVSEAPPDLPTTPVPQLGYEHRGGGRYVVFDRASGEQVSEGYLSREEAEEMVRGEEDA